MERRGFELMAIDTQFAILSEATQRKDRSLIPPKTLKAAAAQKVAAKLLKAGLVREIKAKTGMDGEAQFHRHFDINVLGTMLAIQQALARLTLSFS